MREAVPAAGYLMLPQDIAGYTSQQRRLMLFLPVGETDMTTSTLLPQLLQSRAEPFEPALADTSVFDFPFPDIVIPPFFLMKSSGKSRRLYF